MPRVSLPVSLDPPSRWFSSCHVTRDPRASKKKLRTPRRASALGCARHPAPTTAPSHPVRSGGTKSGPFLLTRLQVHGHVLRLEELLEALLAALAADARLLDAAERRPCVRHHALVQADHAGLEALADADRALDVAREHVGHQAVLGVVGAGDGVLLGFEGADRRDRPEDLL